MEFHLGKNQLIYRLKVAQAADQHQFSAAPSQGETSTESDVSHVDCRETFFKRQRQKSAETRRSKSRCEHKCDSCTVGALMALTALTWLPALQVFSGAKLPQFRSN